MIKTKQVIDRAKSINERLEYVFRTIENNDEKFLQEKIDLRNNSDKMIAEMRLKVTEFLKKEILPIRDFLNDIHTQCFDVGSITESEKEKIGKDFDSQILKQSLNFIQARDFFYQKIKELQGYFEEVNALTNSGQDKIKELFPAALSKLLSCAEFCKLLTYYIESKIKETLNMETFSREAQLVKDEWLRDMEAETKQKNYEAAHQNLYNNNDVISSDFFDELLEINKKTAIDIEYGSGEYKDAINIGSLSLTVTEEKHHKKLISESPILSKYLHDGNQMSTAYLLDLKKCGNIFIETSGDDLTPTALKFIHQTIISFLLSFPAGRLNLCLIDLGDKCDFSRYSKLQAINEKLLYKGIVRDHRDLENAVLDIVKDMHNINDKKLSFAGVDDIYEYNEKSPANPQDFHLVCIIGYPEGFRDETTSKLLSLIEKGNRTGIFTLLTHNKNSILPQGLKKEIYDDFLKKAKKHSFVIKDGQSLKTDISANHSFINNLDVSRDSFGKIFALLQENWKRGVQTTIPLQQMFHDTDMLVEKDKKTTPEKAELVPADRDLDIPIGLRGNEIQTLLLPTLDTNKGSSHTVLIGGTGSGKSNMLHTLILSACYKYSPNDLHIYLVDFKGGVEFKFYEANKIMQNQVPHIRLTGLTSEPEDGVAILANIRNELRERETLFRKTSVEDIVAYNKKATTKLARLLVIIDEVQDLFEKDQKLCEEAIGILSELAKKGRAFGINLLWASQNVPKVYQLRDRVISQMGNRISLRLNNYEDATEISIDPKMVEKLNRPEKGLGVIKDLRNSGGAEFRVAYAENSENRYSKYVSSINKKWAGIDRSKLEPLFIVGGDEIPSAVGGSTIYTSAVKPQSKSAGYVLTMGQDYVSGKPFAVTIARTDSKSNLWFAGTDSQKLRNLMGYSLLSAVSETKSDLDFKTEPKIYYMNGESVSSESELFFSLPSKFPKIINDVSRKSEAINAISAIYRELKKRNEDTQGKHSPIFLFINKLQRFADLFYDETKIDFTVRSASSESVPSSADSGKAQWLAGLSQASSMSSTRPAQGDRLTFTQMFLNILDRGSDVNIHVVLSMDSPQSINQREVTNALKECFHKVLLRGTSATVFDSLRCSNKDDIAFYYKGSELTKFKPYKFGSDDDEWLKKYIKSLGSEV
ncbi:MAG: FtsK/SpoIIIE domain-containing protein [Firmicutes bacterium]|nr:FtsK/SpoIIIE domain-containing protein [Bacillota bacterium]